jgi:hypothetical protein
VKNTIVANSAGGANCLKSPSGYGNITSEGFNLSSDETCVAYFTRPSDWNSADSYLGPLADNGGPTLTHLPMPPSKAIEGGSVCPSPDQRGVTRPQGSACDIGAVEVTSADIATPMPSATPSATATPKSVAPGAPTNTPTPEGVTPRAFLPLLRR